jgi:aryl-alcohol dehydrogenase-like predicted oxidoreductase
VVLRALGNTGLRVSALGFGAGPLGDEQLGDLDAERLLRGAFDLGINVVDTAPSYGVSESRIGRVLATMTAAARDAVVVVTKGGYGVRGVADWTPKVLARGIDRALAQLCTDRIDVFLLHSCPRRRLEQGDLFEPLSHAKAAGKVRAVGYSGDGDALAWAVRCDAFDVVECSVNLVDQEALARALPDATARGMGVLAKRSLAGAPWHDASSAYVDRFRTAYPTPIDAAGEMPWDAIAIRFAAYAPHVGSALMGTRRLARLKAAAAYVAEGPLPAEVAEEVRARFARHGASWPGVV